MLIRIVGKEAHSRGFLYNFESEGKSIVVLFLYHALERMRKWNLKEEVVGETLIYPEEVLMGHNKRFIAQKRYRKHIVRAVYEYESTMPVLVIVYFPYSKEYFQGSGKYEDKIFPRS